MTNSFTKKIMIEQAELDRLQQRQLRDYSPELQAMGRLLNDIRDIMARKKLSAEERMNMISGLQIQFDKLKKNWSVERCPSSSGRFRAIAAGTSRAAYNPSRKRNWTRHRFGQR